MADPVNYCSWLLPSMCASQGEWAAWAQAIMSALAIWYSGRLAFNQARSAKRDRVQTYVRMIALASQESQLAMRFVRGGFERKNPIGGDTYGFAQLRDNLESISFHDVPDPRLVSIIRDAGAACHKLDKHCDMLLNTGEPVDFVNLIEVEDAASVLMQCFMEAADISIELLPYHRRAFRTVVDYARAKRQVLFKRHESPLKNDAD
ncbi:hypothetical protein [Stenotrophomonas maltophilia]|uniref:hypothetical protein n=1 Tax=Stenotrophomonas maltophilia TaxID=40324 RepID=UPI0011B3A45B|nr:hypothetical protein [Stenotrophomonas maltophilia]